jgi:hypothetical protein
MAGYLVLPEEACDWSGSQSGKVKPNPTRLGLADLVRQFEQDPFPFDRRSPGVCLYGLDDFLVQMSQLEDVNETRDWPFLQEMRRRLQTVANEVNNIGNVHVPIRRSLVLGAGKHLFVHSTTGKRIPLWRLFGSHPDISSENGLETYLYGVTLS